MKRLFTRFAVDQASNTSIEYCLIAGLVALVIIRAIVTHGMSTSAKFSGIAINPH